MTQLRADIASCPTADGMVLLDERYGHYWQLNTTGAAVLQALLDGASPEQVADQCAAACPVTRDRAAADIAALLDSLTRAGLLEGAP